MKKLLLFYCTLSSVIYCQDQKTMDVMRKEVKKNIPDSVKLDLMTGTALRSFRAMPEEAIKICQQSLQLATKSKNYKYESKSLNIIGIAYSFIGKYDSAESYYNRSLKIGLLMNDSIIISKAYGNLGLNEFYCAAYEKALGYYFKALKINELKKNNASLANDYANIGNVYIQLNSNLLAINYFKKALPLFEQLGNKQGLSNTLNSLGTVYMEVDSLRNKVIDIYAKAYKLKEELNDRFGMANTLHQLGYLAALNKDYLKEQEYDKKALQIRRELEDITGITISLIDIGNSFYSLHKPKESLPYFIEGLALSLKTGNILHQKHIYRGLSDSYDALNDYKEALRYRKLFAQVSDSVLNEKKSGQIIEMQTKYETEKKEKENIELTKKTEIQKLQLENENQIRKNQLTVGLIVILLITGISIFIYNRKKQQQKQLLAAAEKLRFKDVIDAEEKERSRIAQELHDGLGQLLSTARLNVAGLEDSVIKEDKPDLDRALKIIDDACVEVRNISHNMMPSALIRLGLIPAINELVNNINAIKSLKMDFVTNVNTSLGKSLDITIYRVVQEVLNNMIKHAKADHISMSINKINSDLEISIQDNGIGFDTSELKNSKGIGWKNIFSRVSMLDGNIKLESEKEKGTLVYINLKLKNG